ncbi:MAG: polymer-forming cytoskeletal protein [Thermoanaerobaculia bacterium]|nr:polymer-forming cytoskeletal protein [Thermoanaerobaculia bacterium]
MWNRDDESQPQDQPRPSSRGTGPGTSGPALIGPSIAVRGKLAGKEDLRIEGRFEGEIRVPGNQVTIGRQGKVEAEIRARHIVVEGELAGNLVAEEQAVVRAAGRVEGDIKAPNVVLEEGCQFKGQIDMEPVGKEETEETSESSAEEKQTDESSGEEDAETTKEVGGESESPSPGSGKKPGDSGRAPRQGRLPKQG